MTNLDRIRGMSVVELARFLANLVNCYDYDYNHNCGECPLGNITNCISTDRITKWLESEVGENDTE